MASRSLQGQTRAGGVREDTHHFGRQAKHIQNAVEQRQKHGEVVFDLQGMG